MCSDVGEKPNEARPLLSRSTAQPAWKCALSMYFSTGRPVAPLPPCHRLTVISPVHQLWGVLPPDLGLEGAPLEDTWSPVELRVSPFAPEPHHTTLRCHPTSLSVCFCSFVYLMNTYGSPSVCRTLGWALGMWQWIRQIM